MSLAALLRGDTVSVTSYGGETAYGPGYGPAVDVTCRVEYGRKLVRNTAGDEVVSESTIYVLPTLPDGTKAVDVFAVESLVTHEGRTATVIGAAPHRGMGDTVYVEVTTT